VVSTEPAAATLLEGGDVDTDVNLAAFERLSVLFELSVERAAIAVLVTRGLAGQPGLAGELARRWGFVAVDLTSDEDPLADPAEVHGVRVLVGMSLLSQERRREWLIRLNRGRDRIQVLGLHVVLLLDEVDVRVLHELAPDFASRVHELIEIDASAFMPARAGVLSPLGPVGRPEPDEGSFLQPRLIAELSGLGIKVIFGDEAPPPGTAIDVAWSFADSTHAWVAWLERDRWDDERITRWLTELGIPRLLVVLGGDGSLEVRSDIASMLWIKAPAERVEIALTPELPPEVEPSAAPSRRAGKLTWLIHDDGDRELSNEIISALAQRGVVVVRSGDYAAFKLRAHSYDDVAILLLSPAALGSRQIVGIAEMLRPHEHWQPKGRSIVLLDRVSSSTARELVGPDAKLLTLRSPNETADDIARILPILRLQQEMLRVLLIVARPAALPLLDPRASVAAIAEALAGLESRVDLHVLLRSSFREIVKEIHDAHDDGHPFQIIHIDAHASSNDKGQICIALDGENELSIPLVQFAVELYGRHVGLCVLDLHWPSGMETLALETRARDLLKQVGVQGVITTSTSGDQTTHHELIASVYEAIVAGEPVETEGGSSVPLVPDLRPARQTPVDDGIPRTDGFVDRFDTLLELDDALRRHSVLLILGAEGVGKSALAAEFARWQRQMRRFDPVIWLTPESPSDGLLALAVQLSLSESNGEEDLRKVLGTRDVLLVLDGWNEWDESTIRAVGDWLALSQRLRILITTRERPEQQPGWFALQLSPRS
jgi:hypothetical protein